PGNVAARLELLEHRLRLVDRHGKADSYATLRTVDGGVDADDVAVRIEQRTAAIAGIDGGVRLNHAFQPLLLGLNVAIDGAHDAGGKCAFEVEGIADGQHLLSH